MHVCREGYRNYLVCACIFLFLFWLVLRTGDRNEKVDTACSNVFKPWNRSIIITPKRDVHFNYQSEMDKLNNEKVSADDPRLVKLIRNYYINLPSDLPYNLRYPDALDPSKGQAPFVDNRLGYKEKGFYVESGGFNGEELSNTLFFERMRNWNGILIEPDPKSFQQLQRKHRKAYSLNGCVSIHPYPSKEYLTTKPGLGKIVTGDSDTQLTVAGAQCFPLYSILLALNQTTVDFFSLDVEGMEYYVLETIPWNKVDIKMMAVEKNWPDGMEGSLREYIEHKGYEYLMHIAAPGANDIILRKK